MEWLKEILTQNQDTEAALELIKKELPKHFVPKARYNEVAEAKKLTEENLTIANSAKAEYENSVRALKKTALDNAVKALKPKDSSLITLLLDTEGITFNDDGGLEGFDNQIEEIKKQRPFLFDSEFLKGKTPFAAEGEKTAVTKADFAKMGYKERMDIYRSSPDLYNLLQND